MSKLAKQVFTYVLVLILLINVIPIVSVGKEVEDPFKLMMDMHFVQPDKKKVIETSLNDLIVSGDITAEQQSELLMENNLNYLERSIEQDFFSKSDVNIASIAKEILNVNEGAKAVIGDISSFEILEAKVLENYSKEFEAAKKTDRYIVKYRTGKMELFKDKLPDEVHSGELSENIELIAFEEKQNPVELAATLKRAGAGADIVYIQPDFTLEISAFDEEGSRTENYNDDGSEAAEIGENNNGQEETNETVENETQNSEEERKNDHEDSDDLKDSAEENEEFEDPEAFLLDENKGQKIIVALIDTGVDTWRSEIYPYIDHENAWNVVDDSDNVYDDANPMTENHGTHIAGIIAGFSDVDSRMIKPDDNIVILPIKVFQGGVAYTSDIILAIDHAEQAGAKIVNCSFGSTNQNFALKDAMEESEMFFIVAAGNSRFNLDEIPVYPACFDIPNIINVTSSNADSGLSYFSNYGKESVDIAAVGRNIKSIIVDSDEGYGTYTGTSMSAAIVTAVAARLLTEDGGLDNEELKYRFIDCADKVNSLEGKVSEAANLDIEATLNGKAQWGIREIIWDEDFEPYVDNALTLYNTTKAIKVSAGINSNLVLKEDGTVWAWGENDEGQCGIGAASRIENLSKVIGLSDVIDVSMGGSHAMALKSDGTVWTWGYNWAGQLGDGTTCNRYVPVQVGGLEFIEEISAGDNYCLALKEDGTVWAWGYNEAGAVGDGTDSNRSHPQRVLGLGSDVKKIDAGYGHNLALRENETVWTWGENRLNQNDEDIFIPQRVEEITRAREIAAGYTHSMALAHNETLWTWGSNGSGQLGDGTFEDRYRPVQCYGPELHKISSGNNFSLGLDEEGSMWAWGDNSYWQLGIGQGDDNALSEPVKIEGVGKVKQISAGYEHSLALDENGSVWIWGSMWNGSAADVYEKPALVFTNIMEDDHGDTFEDATLIELVGRRYGGFGVINHSNDVDMFKFISEQDVQSRVSVASAAGRAVVRIYDEEENLITDQCLSAALQFESGREYYIEVVRNPDFMFTQEIPYVLTLLLEGDFELYVTDGEIYYVPFFIQGGNTFDEQIFEIRYDPKVMDVLDLVCQTPNTVQSPGLVEGSDIEILEHSPDDGLVLFTIHKEIDEGKTFQGTVNYFKFRAIDTGKTIIESK